MALLNYRDYALNKYSSTLRHQKGIRISYLYIVGYVNVPKVLFCTIPLSPSYTNVFFTKWKNEKKIQKDLNNYSPHMG